MLISRSKGQVYFETVQQSVPILEEVNQSDALRRLGPDILNLCSWNIDNVCSVVHSPSNTPCEAVQQQAWCCCVHDVHSRVQGCSKANNHHHCHQQACIAAVHTHTVLTHQQQNLRWVLERMSDTLNGKRATPEDESCA